MSFLVLFISGLQAQTPQTKLDQVELIRQFLGTWKGEMASIQRGLAFPWAGSVQGTPGIWSEGINISPIPGNPNLNRNGF